MNLFAPARSYIRSKFFGKPFYAHFYVTRKCNLRCPMCNIPYCAKNDNDLTLDEISVLAKQLRKIGLSILVLTGGEPFLRSDLPEIIGIFAKQGITIRAQTNGLLASTDILDNCFRSGLEFLTVSLDSTDKNKFDGFCAKQGTWDAAVSAIRHAVSKKPGALHIVNTVVSKLNIGELAEIARFVDNIGAFSSFVPMHIDAGHNLIRSADSRWLLSGTERAAIEKSYEELIALKKEGVRIGSSIKYLKDSLEYLTGSSLKWDCDAGRYYFAIFPDGKISVCDEFEGLDTERGSLAGKVFKSLEFAKYKLASVNNCQGCIWGCWRETSYLLNRPTIFFERTKDFFHLFSSQ